MRRIVQKKPTYLYVKDKFNKSFKHSIEFNEFTYDILKSDVRVCCVVYLLIPVISTSRTVTVDAYYILNKLD